MAFAPPIHIISETGADHVSEVAERGPTRLTSYCPSSLEAKIDMFLPIELCVDSPTPDRGVLELPHVFSIVDILVTQLFKRYFDRCRTRPAEAQNKNLFGKEGCQVWAHEVAISVREALATFLLPVYLPLISKDVGVDLITCMW